MIMIEFYRFVVEDPSNVIPMAAEDSTIFYKEILDKTICRQYSAGICLQKCMASARRYLKDHYGFVNIYMDFNHPHVSNHKICLGNRKAFRSKFTKEGVNVRKVLL